MMKASSGRIWRLPANHRFYPCIVAVAAIVMVLRVAATCGVFNDSIDEPYHLGSGIAQWQSGRHVYAIQHPPLPRLVAAFPLYLAGVRTADPQLGRIVDDLRGFEVGHEVLLRGKFTYWKTLTLARIPMLVFALACILYVYRLGSFLGSGLIGCMAAVMFSSDPTLLGHSSWVATDVAACAGYLAGIYHGLRLIARPTIGRMWAAGIAIGLGLACKFTCALVIPALLIIWLMRGRRAAATMRRAGPLAAVSLLIAFITLWATYFFDFGRIDRLNMPDETSLRRLPAWVRRLPLPMPTALAGLAVLAEHNQQGHPAYLNGKVSMQGWWMYFPEAIVIKSPVALSVGVVCATILMLMRLQHARGALRTAALLVPFGMFLGVCMASRLHIGIRHVLPAMPFLYLFIAMWLARGRGKLVLLLVGLVASIVVETAVVHPDYLAYFNGLVGGPSNGHKYLLDSNLDWGQDLWRLRTWLETNASGRVVSLRTFGNPRLREWPLRDVTLAPEYADPKGLFAVSKNYIYVYPLAVSDESGNRRIEAPMRWLQHRRPVARIGYSIEVYSMP